MVARPLAAAGLPSGIDGWPVWSPTRVALKEDDQDEVGSTGRLVLYHVGDLEVSWTFKCAVDLAD
jgi:hypothetical protein